MAIYHYPGDFQLDQSVCLTIGNFDGVHKGHIKLVEKTKKIARQRDLIPVLVTFQPHPALVLNKGNFHGLLTTREDKMRLLEAAGIENILEIPFNKEFSQLSPEDFLRKWLLPLNISHIATGHDFCFGQGKKGNFTLLAQLGKKRGFTVSKSDILKYKNTGISSSLLRNLLREGNISPIPDMLGRFYQLTGTVGHGFGRGREIGYPTANLENTETIIPGNGVYATFIRQDESLYRAVTNIGNNPTFNGDKITIESFLLDTDINLYGKEIRIYFIEKIRSEIKFSSSEELTAQIGRDINIARSILGNFHGNL